jgi:hypothetical protein
LSPFRQKSDDSPVLSPSPDARPGLPPYRWRRCALSTISACVSAAATGLSLMYAHLLSRCRGSGPRIELRGLGDPRLAKRRRLALMASLMAKIRKWLGMGNKT